MWNFRCRVWILKFSSESSISARHPQFSDFIRDFQSKNKKFQVSSGYVQLDTWNFLSSTSEIFCSLKKERSFRNFVWVKWYNFNEFKLFGAWTYINTDYRLHEQSPWILEPFYAFAPWAAGKTFQRSRRPPILEASTTQQQTPWARGRSTSFLQLLHVALQLSIPWRPLLRHRENLQTKRISALWIFDFSRKRASSCIHCNISMSTIKISDVEM